MFVQVIILSICFIIALTLRFTCENGLKTQKSIFFLHFTFLFLSILLFFLDTQYNLKLKWLNANEIIYTIAFCTGILSFGLKTNNWKLNYYFGTYMLTIFLSFLISLTPYRIGLIFWIILIVKPTEVHKLNEDFSLKRESGYFSPDGFYLTKREAIIFNRKSRGWLERNNCSYNNAKAVVQKDTLIIYFKNKEGDTGYECIEKVHLKSQF